MAVNSNDDARFKVVEYSPEKAEMIGYSNYSYWKSVFHNFLKKKSATGRIIDGPGFLVEYMEGSFNTWEPNTRTSE